LEVDYDPKRRSEWDWSLKRRRVHGPKGRILYDDDDDDDDNDDDNDGKP
jgi:hypothetical protein